MSRKSVTQAWFPYGSRWPGAPVRRSPQFRIRFPTDVLSELRGRRVLTYSTDPDERDPQTGRIVNQGRPFVAIPRIGMEIQFSLGIDDTNIAAARNADALHHLQKLFSLYRTNPVNLMNKDMLMYAGVVYRTYVDVHEGDPGKPSDWAYHKALHRAVLEGRIPVAPAAALIHEDAAAAIELFGDGDLTQAVDELPANQHDGLCLALPVGERVEFFSECRWGSRFCLMVSSLPRSSV